MNYHGVRRCCIKDLPVIKLIQKKKKMQARQYKLQLQLSSLSKQFFPSRPLHFSLLTWLKASFSRKPIKREACSRAKISGVISHLWIFMSRLWRRSMNLNKVIFLIHRSWRTEKVIGEKSQSGPIALLSLIMFLEANVYVNNKCRHGSKREDVWLKPEINKCYFGRIAYICGNSPQMQLL